MTLLSKHTALLEKQKTLLPWVKHTLNQPPWSLVSHHRTDFSGSLLSSSFLPPVSGWDSSQQAGTGWNLFGLKLRGLSPPRASGTIRIEFGVLIFTQEDKIHHYFDKRCWSKEMFQQKSFQWGGKLVPRSRTVEKTDNLLFIITVFCFIIIIFFWVSSGFFCFPKRK